MKNTTDPELLLNVYWLFNTPFIPYVSNHRVDRPAVRTNSEMFFVSIKGDWVWFINYAIAPITDKGATIMQIADSVGRYHSLRFSDEHANPVPLSVVFDYLKDHHLFGYRTARAMTLFTEVCSKKPTKQICTDWQISRYGLNLILADLIQQIAKNNPEFCTGHRADLRGLKKHSAQWLQQLQLLKTATRVRLSKLAMQ